MIGTRMTRMKGKRFFRFAQEYTDKGRIGRASLCFGLKCIRFYWDDIFGKNRDDRNRGKGVQRFKSSKVQR
jgi:hypothetical protein